MDVTVLKLILLVVMIFGVLLAGLLPLKVLKYLRRNAARASSSKQHKHISLVLCLLTCFSGGVFLATCFLHLYPELVESLDSLKETYNIHVDYPIAELLSCIGFFLLFFLEEVIIMAIPSMAHGHSHGGGHSHHVAVAHSEEGVAAKESGCCMSNVVPPVRMSSVERKRTSDEVDEPMLVGVARSTSDVEDDADGHCQKHCPLTVHRRHEAAAECSQDAVHDNLMAVILAEPERCETNCDKVKEHPPILMKSAPHAHSHGVRSITFVVAISIHEVIEGMAFGLIDKQEGVVALFLSLMVHKVIVAFSIGLQLARTHAHQLHLVVISMVIIALTSPVGAVMGIVLEGSSMDPFVKELLITFLQGLAVGTFLYVTFFEVLLHERDNEHPNLLKLLLMLVGFTLIALIRCYDTHGHAHGHSHAPPNCTVLPEVHSEAIGHSHGHSHEH